MDIADLAQDTIDATLAAALAAARRPLHLVPQPHDATGRACCADCGEPIPAARLAILPRACRCAGCQGRAERWPG